MNWIRVASGIAIVAITPTLALSQARTSCVLSGSNTLQPAAAFENSTLEVQVALTPAPAYLDPVPMRVGHQAECRLHVSPQLGVQQFRLRVAPTLRAEGTAQDTALLRLQIVPRSTEQPVFQMDPIEVRSGNAAVGGLRLQSPVNAAGEFELAMLVTRVRDGKQSQLPFTLLWTPSVNLDLAGPLTDCAATAICLTAGVDSEISVTGPGANQVDPTGRVVLNSSTFGLAAAERTLRGGNSNALSFPLTLTTANSGTLEAQVPLAIARLRVVGGTIEEVRTVAVRKDLIVQPRPAARADVRADDGEILRHITIDASPVPIMIQALASDFQQFFRPEFTYRVREWSLGKEEGKSVAEFVFNRYEAGRAVGALRPLAATTRQPLYSLAPRLVLQGEGNRTLEFQLIILPEQSVSRYVIVRGPSETVGGNVYPTEKISLRVEGPAASYIQKGELNGLELTRQTATSRDSITFQEFRVPREVGGTARVRLWGANGQELPQVLIPVVPAANALTDRLETFAWIERRRGSRATKIPLDSERVELPDLRGVVLRVNPEQIETGATELAGVQYLTVSLKLTDFQGTEHGQQTLCLAVVPPPVNGSAYPFDSSCTRVIGGEFALSDLIDATNRATQQSTLQIQVGHDLSKYTKPSQPNTRQLRLVRRGNFPITPSVSLPGMMMTFQPSRNWRGGTAVAYTGAMVGVQPLVGPLRPRSGFSFTASMGFVVKTPEGQQSTNTLAAQLSGIVAGSLKILDMSGKVSFDLMLGYVQPLDQGIRWRQGQVVLYPGFKLVP